MKKLLYLILISFFTIINACKMQKDGFNKNELVEKIEKMYNSDQANRLFLNKLKKSNLDKEVFKRKKDSIWKLQLVIDEQNTKDLIEITNKHGFPNTDFLEKPIAAWVIFQHTPEKYKEEVKNLLIKEINVGRLPAIEGSMIMWHLNGRNGTPLGLRERGVIVKDLRKKNDTNNK
ncbi:hypothetical protein [Tenacibaculum xiamenense]|uniref:hypothetical protein n=1 Tax=Tenacibaculum xiamenense TaxID=1261553 RepID=UPI0038946FFA